MATMTTTTWDAAFTKVMKRHKGTIASNVFSASPTLNYLEEAALSAVDLLRSTICDPVSEWGRDPSTEFIFVQHITDSVVTALPYTQVSERLRRTLGLSTSCWKEQQDDSSLIAELRFISNSLPDGKPIYVNRDQFNMFIGLLEAQGYQRFKERSIINNQLAFQGHPLVIGFADGQP